MSFFERTRFASPWPGLALVAFWATMEWRAICDGRVVRPAPLGEFVTTMLVSYAMFLFAIVCAVMNADIVSLAQAKVCRKPLHFLKFVLKGCRSGLLFFLCAMPVMALIWWVASLFGIEPESQDVVNWLSSGEISGLYLWIMISAIVVVSPIVEEIFFRMYLFQALEHRLHSKRKASIYTALIFGGIHFNAASFPVLAVFSLYLVGIFRREGSIVAPVAAHMSFNAISAFLAINVAGA